jgi:hypothetical protein
MLNDDGNFNHISRIWCIYQMLLVHAASAKPSEFTDITESSAYISHSSSRISNFSTKNFEELMTLKEPVKSCFADEKHA